MEGLLYAALVLQTIASGRIAALDTAAAEAAPGVALVMTHRNAPRMKPPQAFGEGDGVAGSNLPIMQDDSHPLERPAGRGGARRDAGAGRPRRALVAVTYDAGAGRHRLRGRARPSAHPPGTILGEPPGSRSAMPRRRWPRRRHRVDRPTARRATTTTPSSCTPRPSTGRTITLIVHDATQMITGTAGSLAQVFGLKPEQVRVLSPFVGGGFGGKGLWSHQILAAAASKLAGRPVRLVLTREGVFRLVGGRTPTEQRVALGAQATAGSTR